MSRINLVIFFSLLFLQVEAQTDSLIIYDPYIHTKVDTVVSCDENSKVGIMSGNLGEMGNKVELELDFSDTSITSFTKEYLTSKSFDMLSYPIRTNIALLHYRYINNSKAGEVGFWYRLMLY